MATYVSWEDLANAGKPAVVEAWPESAAGVQPLTAAAVEKLGGSSELVSLLHNKEELEAQLKQFGIGQREAPADARQAKRFPVKVHTKETRIEERRLRLRDEALAALNQRRLEAAHVERVRAEREAEGKRRQAELARIRRLEGELRDQAQRKALMDAQLAARRKRIWEQALEQDRQARVRVELARAQAAALSERRQAEQARLEDERRALHQRWRSELMEALVRARREQKDQLEALLASEELRRTAALKRAVATRQEKLDENLAESKRREAEAKLRAERRLKVRAQESAFARRREKVGQAASARRLAEKRVCAQAQTRKR